MTYFAIHKDRDIPTKGNPEFMRKYPIDILNVGEGFDFPIENIKNVRSAVTFYKKRNAGVRFRVVKINPTTGTCKCIERAQAIHIPLVGTTPVTVMASGPLRELLTNKEFSDEHKAAATKELTRRGELTPPVDEDEEEV